MSKGSMAVLPGQVGRPHKSEEIEITDAQIAAMSGPEKFAECLRRAIARTPGDLKKQLEGMFEPAALAAAGTLLAVGIGLSASNPAGWVLGAMTLAGITVSCMPLAWDMANAGWILRTANTNADIDRAAEYLADFIINLGFAAFGAFMGKGITLATNAMESRRAAFVSRRLRVDGEFGKGPKPRSRNLMEDANVSSVASAASFTVAEVETLMLQAKMTNQIGIYRICRPERLSWLARRFPTKPIFVKAKTSPTTGLATCRNEEEVRDALKYGYAVVKQEGGNWVLQTEDGIVVMSDPNWWKSWPIEVGQVLDNSDLGQMLPFIGDIDAYDFFSIADLTDLVVSGIARKRGRGLMTDWGNAAIERSSRMINGRLSTRYRRASLPMQHGPHMASDYDPAAAGKVLIVFPNGVMIFEESAVLAETLRKLGRVRRVLGN